MGRYYVVGYGEGLLAGEGIDTQHVTAYGEEMAAAKMVYGYCEERERGEEEERGGVSEVRREEAWRSGDQPAVASGVRD